MEFALKAVAIAVAPNGGRRTKVDHPNIPLTSQELAQTAAECAGAGAAMVHIHVRQADGRHLLDADAYRQATAAIRAEVGADLVIQVTSEALGLYSPDQQIAVVKDTRPEAVSLALRELAPSPADETRFAGFLLWLKAENVLPQIILYDPAEAIRLADMQRRGLVPWSSVPTLLVLGRYSVGQTSQPSDLLPFIGPEMPRFAHWSVCAFGRHEAACVLEAAAFGGHVRVGFENNLHLPDGKLAASNRDLVEAVSDGLAASGRIVQSAAELRQALGAI